MGTAAQNATRVACIGRGRKATSRTKIRGTPNRRKPMTESGKRQRIRVQPFGETFPCALSLPVQYPMPSTCPPVLWLRWHTPDTYENKKIKLKYLRKCNEKWKERIERVYNLSHYWRTESVSQMMAAATLGNTWRAEEDSMVKIPFRNIPQLL